MPEPLTICHARVVLRDEVVNNARVVTGAGVITAIETEETSSPPEGPVIDAAGAYLLPALIDTHNDGLESEINPRPRVNFPPEFALANFERRAAAAGVATIFHAIMFASFPRQGRSVDHAVAITKAIRERAGQGLIRHAILHRCDLWSPDGLDPLFASLRDCDIQALSLNDHTPGRGQYRDVEKYLQVLRAYRAAGRDVFLSDNEAEIEQRIAERAADTVTVPGVLARISAEHRRQPVTLVSHDDDTPERVDRFADLGAAIAEFPVTWEAARRARERGMEITVGAPNIVRGASTGGNLSARELVGEGLTTIICGDYHTPALLCAAFTLSHEGLCTLPDAVAMVTANPAHTFGLGSTGRIAPGYAADLCLVSVDAGLPTVRTLLRAGKPVLSLATRTA